VDEIERAKNRTKSKVRSKVEHSIGVIKRVFGFAKVRYRGLDKNANRLFVTCALANLFLARGHLLRWQGAWRAQNPAMHPCQTDKRKATRRAAPTSFQTKTAARVASLSRATYSDFP
jgi:IS5 family transposase